MTYVSHDEYLSTNCGCPQCRSTDINYGTFQVDTNAAWQPAECQSCGLQWNDLYQLSGYEVTTKEAT